MSEFLPIRHAPARRVPGGDPETVYTRQKPSLRQLSYYVAPYSGRLVIYDLLEDGLSDLAKEAVDKAGVA